MSYVLFFTFALLGTVFLSCDSTEDTRTLVGSGPAGKLVITAGLSPDPSTVDLSQVGPWNQTPFRVTLSHPVFDWVKVVANPPGFDSLIELGHLSPGPNSWSYCPPEGSDFRYRRPGESVYLQVCRSGTATLLITTIEGIPIDTLQFEVGQQPDLEELDESFDIELVFVDQGVYDHREKEWIRQAARKWESIITEGLPDASSYATEPYTFTAFWGETFTVDDRIDDIRIYVGAWNQPDKNTLAWGGARHVRGDSYLPMVATFAFNSAKMDRIERLNGFYSIALHEMAHCLGFTDWYWEPEQLDLIRSPSVDNPGADSHFIGIKAIAAFNQAGGWNYQGAKVPLENHPDISQASRDSHWRTAVFQNEVMDTYAGIGQYLSEVTIAVFEDMGYQVDYSQADSYTLPRDRSKPAAEHPHESWCEVLHPEGAVTPDGELIEF